MTSKDIQSIFGLKSSKTTGNKTNALPKTKAFNRKWSREARSLVGGDHVPTMVLVPRIDIPALKQTKAVKWTKERIQSSARRQMVNSVSGKDDLSLTHWVRFPNQDYHFSRFNKRIRIQIPTQEEYTKLLSGTGWSRADDEKLLALCTQYDCRFPVIEDRYNSGVPIKSGGISEAKSIEQLKDRFYHMQKILVKHRKETNWERSPFYTEHYDIQHEVTRKAELAKLYSRSYSTDRQMAELVLANRTNDLEIRKLKREAKMTSSLVNQTTAPKPKQVTPELNLSELPSEVIPKDLFYPRSTGISLRSHMLNSSVVNAPYRQLIENDIPNLKISKLWNIPTESFHNLYNILRQTIVIRSQLINLIARKRREIEAYRTPGLLGMSTRNKLTSKTGLQPPLKKLKMDNK